jgi:hypothetical protein
MGLIDVSSLTNTIDHYASQTGLTPSQLSLGVVALAGGVGLYLFNRSDGNNSNPYGPGPKGVPILGNASDIPTGDQPWLDYMQWAKKYGEFGQLSMFNANTMSREIYLYASLGTTDILDQ